MRRIPGACRKSKPELVPGPNPLTVEIQRGEKNALVVVLDLKSGNVQPLGEGVNPTWSPTKDWISYYDPTGAKCLLVYPDGTGLKIVKNSADQSFPIGLLAGVVPCGHPMVRSFC